MIVSLNVALPLVCVLFAVKVQLFKATEFCPSMQTPSERFDVSMALLT